MFTRAYRSGRTGVALATIILSTAVPALGQTFPVSRQLSVQQTGWFRKYCEPCQPVCPPGTMEAQPIPAEPPVQVRPAQPPAQQPAQPPAQPSRPTPEAPTQPQPPQQPQQPQPTQPDMTPFDSQDFSSALETAGGPSSLSPGMLGDFIGIIYKVPSNLVIDTPQEQAQARILNRYKIADNTSPLPQTRLLYSYNFFSDAFNSTGDVHRNTFGAELAFMNNLFSFEIRQALDTFVDFPGASDKTNAANLRTVLKAVLYRQQSYVLTGGLGVGYPTGDRVPGTPDDNFILTPFIGYFARSEGSSWFIQGFEQLDLPTNDDDQILLHTDFGIGYWLLDRMGSGGWGITAIIPTVELHLYTPIGDDPTGQLLGLVYQDVLNTTLGTTFFFGEATSISLGLGLPLSTQKDYDYELQCHLQWRFGSSRGSRYTPFSG